MLNVISRRETFLVRQTTHTRDPSSFRSFCLFFFSSWRSREEAISRLAPCLQTLPFILIIACFVPSALSGTPT